MSNFTDVGRFHRKFGIEHLEDGPPRPLPPDLLRFRLGFLIEELKEYADAVGYVLRTDLEVSYPEVPNQQDLEKAFDSLVDLVYVALGTAHVHRFPWDEGWNEVQRANMGKERCGINHRYQQGLNEDRCCKVIDDADADGMGGVPCGEPRAKHSMRGSAHDIIKPAGWTPPNIARVLARWIKRLK